MRWLILSRLALAYRAMTYFVDSVNGNDVSNSGTDMDHPFRTLLTASLAARNAGDTLLLKSGSTWHNETLSITATAITVGSYGTGPQPTLDGGTNNRAPIELINASNVRITGLTVQNARTLLFISGGHDNTVEKCTLKNANVFAVEMGASENFVFDNNVYSVDDNFTMQGDIVRVNAVVEHVVISNNILRLNDKNHRCAGIYVIDANNVKIFGNTIVGGSQSIGVKGYTRSVFGADVYDNQAYYPDNRPGEGEGRNADGEGIEFTGVHQLGPWTVSGSIHHNFVVGGPHTTNAIAAYYGTDIDAYNNIVAGSVQNAAFHWSSNSTGGALYGNTVHGSKVGFAVLSGSSAKIMNNIVAKVVRAVSFNAAGEGTMEDYNIFSEQVSSAMGTHTKRVDPQFVLTHPSSPLDFRLPPDSPAVHSGMELDPKFKFALDSQSSGFPCELLDQTIHGWNIGAFGYI
jgi:parallel beta helix pectate lyase-like protein